MAVAVSFLARTWRGEERPEDLANPSATRVVHGFMGPVLRDVRQMLKRGVPDYLGLCCRCRSLLAWLRVRRVKM